MSKSSKTNSNSNNNKSSNSVNRNQQNTASASYKEPVKTKTSYVDELDEEQIKEEQAEYRYEKMMKNFKKLTRSEENEEENENLEKFYKENAPKKRNNYKVPELKTTHEEVDDSGQNGIRAPNELKEEFIVYIMEKKWEDAFKLCKFILMYEPDNEIAREYLPLIEIKLNQSESESEDESSSDDEDDDDDSDKGSEDDYEDESESTDSDEDKRDSKEKIIEKEEEIKRLRETYKQMKPTEDYRSASKQSDASSCPKNTKYAPNTSSSRKSK